MNLTPPGLLADVAAHLRRAAKLGGERVPLSLAKIKSHLLDRHQRAKPDGRWVDGSWQALRYGLAPQVSPDVHGYRLTAFASLLRDVASHCMSATRIRIPDQVEDFFRTARPGRRRLLALTYRFNSSAFERQFGRVMARGIQVDVVMGDDPPAPGDQYRIWRANWPGTFHPKVLLLLANEQIMLGLGSANLTAEGLGRETWRPGRFSTDTATLLCLPGCVSCSNG